MNKFELPEGIEPYDLSIYLKKVGYAVVIFSPEEVEGINLNELEDYLIQMGSEYIEQLNRGRK